MTFKPGLGRQELEVLRFISSHDPASVGEVAEQYGERQGLARSTVKTMMERLRRKGYLTRSSSEGVFRYSPRMPQSDVMRGLVQDFVENTLGGSLTPFVAYLAESRSLSREQIQELERLADELDARPEGE